MAVFFWVSIYIYIYIVTYAVKWYLGDRLRGLEDATLRKELEAMRRRELFERNQATCREAVQSLLPVVEAALRRRIDTGALTARLVPDPGPREKLAVWEELKVAAVAQAIASVYVLAAVVVCAKLQLNVVGGYLYRELGTNNNVSDDDTNGRHRNLPADALGGARAVYLECTRAHLVTHGLDTLVDAVLTQVAAAVGSVPLRHGFDANGLAALLQELRAGIEAEGLVTRRLQAVFVPPAVSTTTVTAAAAAAAAANGSGITPLDGGVESVVDNNKMDDMTPSSASVVQDRATTTTTSATAEAVDAAAAAEAAEAVTMGVAESSGLEFGLESGVGLGLLSRQHQTAEGAAELRALLDETRDLVETPEFSAAFSRCLDLGTARLCSDLTGELFATGPGSSSSSSSSSSRDGAPVGTVAASSVLLPSTTAPVTKVIPAMSRRASALFGAAAEPGSDLLAALETDPQVVAFARAVFETFSR